MDSKKVVVVGTVLALGIWALSKIKASAGNMQALISAKWGENGLTGPQTIVYGTSQLLVLTVSNPTTKSWTYDIMWMLGDKLGAIWRGITVEAKSSVELKWDRQFTD